MSSLAPSDASRPSSEGQVERFLRMLAAPLIGGPELSFYSNNTIEECVQQLAREVGPLTLPRQIPALVGKASSEQVVIYKPRAIRIPWPTFHGAFVEADGWVELRGRFAWNWFSKAWFAFWPALFLFLAVLWHSFVLLLPALVWIGIGDLFWWVADRDRMDISAVMQRCLRSPEKAAARRTGESTLA